MPEHEYFEEKCAAASIGQVSGAELAELREHLAWCSLCQERYGDFLAINGAHYARNRQSEELSWEIAVSAINSDLFRERFLRKAEAEGIVFSGDGAAYAIPEAAVAHSQSRWRWPRLAPAAMLMIASGVGIGGYYVGRNGTHVPTISRPAAFASAPSERVERATLSKLEADNRDLSAEIASLRSSLKSETSKLSVAVSKLSEAESAGAVSEQDRLLLQVRIKEGEDRIADLQARLDQAQTRVAHIQADYDKAQASLGGSQAQHIEDLRRIRELSDQLLEKSSQLARDRDLLAAGRDVRELMSARNLHIVDVFNTDPRGKTRPAFGRIFFTEGKSLLFYAYDMPDARPKNASYQYRIWGKKEGPNQRARNLGIFFHDDAAQRRWVFQYSDAKVLNEIDSVFVTFEPPDGNPNQPKGDKLLYAYLKGQPNHP